MIPHRHPTLTLFAIAATLLGAGCLPSVAWLPDGKRIAYVQGGAAWITDLAGQRTKLYDAPGETAWFVSTAPAGHHLAVVTASAGFSRVAFTDDRGSLVWSVTVPGGGTADSEGPSVALAANPWGPEGTRLLVMQGPVASVLDLAARSVTLLPDPVVDARLTPEGEMLVLSGTRTGNLQLVRVARSGRRDDPLPWLVPAGTPDDARAHLTADGSAVWIAQGGPGNRAVLADRGGKVLFSSAREVESLGPDDQAYLTRDGGWALVRVGGPVLNLNPAYNRLIQAEMNWQMADTGSGDAPAIKPEPEFMSLPAWSPDHTRFAVMTKSMLVVIEPATNSVTPLAKW